MQVKQEVEEVICIKEEPEDEQEEANLLLDYQVEQDHLPESEVRLELNIKSENDQQLLWACSPQEKHISNKLVSTQFLKDSVLIVLLFWWYCYQWSVVSGVHPSERNSLLLRQILALAFSDQMDKSMRKQWNISAHWTGNWLNALLSQNRMSSDKMLKKRKRKNLETELQWQKKYKQIIKYHVTR